MVISLKIKRKYSTDINAVIVDSLNVNGIWHFFGQSYSKNNSAGHYVHLLNLNY